MTEQAPSTEQRWTRLIGSRVSRRSVIRGGVIGAAGLTAAALIGCGDDDDEAPAARRSHAGSGGRDGSGDSRPDRRPREDRDSHRNCGACGNHSGGGSHGHGAPGPRPHPRAY